MDKTIMPDPQQLAQQILECVTKQCQDGYSDVTYEYFRIIIKDGGVQISMNKLEGEEPDAFVARMKSLMEKYNG